jgi:hypothetical protein
LEIVINENVQLSELDEFRAQQEQEHLKYQEQLQMLIASHEKDKKH